MFSHMHRKSRPANSFFRGLSTAVALCALVSLTNLTGCSSTPAGSAEEDLQYQLAWPAPPEEPRFVFEAELRNQSDIRDESDEDRLKRILTGHDKNSEQPVYRKPSALAARKGRLYVADPHSASIYVFDMPRRKVFQIGQREPNRTRSPISMAIDAQSRLYVLDSSAKKVMVFDSLGLFMFSVGNPGDLVKPAGVAVSPDGSRIVIVDRGSVDVDDHKVIAYAPDGKELFRIGPRGTDPGQLNIPLDATIAEDGTLHILDSGNFRIQSFDETGKFLSSFGSVGNGLGSFSRPRRITSDAEGNIYVSDASFNNVQIFTPDGSLLMWVGKAGIANLPGQYALIGAITVDETGRLYVADQYHLKVEVFRRAGTGSVTGASARAGSAGRAP